jgi:hypothetical protein
MTKTRGQREDEPHMGRGEQMKRGLVPMFLPPHGKQPLLLAFEEWSIHGGPHETTANSRDFSHRVLPGARCQLTMGEKVQFDTAKFANLDSSVARTRHSAGFL